MYEDLINKLRELPHLLLVQLGEHEDVIYQAADAIEELQQTVEHYKGCSDDWFKEACDYKLMLPRWIPVTERLPEKNGFYLCCYEAKNKGGVAMDEGLSVIQYFYGNWHLRKWHLIDTYKVTCWMEIPEPPEEEHE